MKISKWNKEKEILEFLILNEKQSYEEIGRKYGCTGTNIKKIARQLGIKLEKRRKINPNETFRKGEGKKIFCKNCSREIMAYKSYAKEFCCKECFKEYKHQEQYKLILEGDKTIMRANYSPRSFKNDILKEQSGTCAICGCMPEHNGKPLIFIIDHIDGHASNNKRENLRCICPNCDSQLETYKSKNKNGDRAYYRYHKHLETGGTNY